ncbi:S8 family serine peptidase [Streptomyces coeruleorubidus]|uniref:S8 family serine peptidase n=1 Tax=Streptomyces coeruleorubidus TaxID=116188 RepID=UPI00237FCC2E|nr:S8 family serine peptidase [Streptomyces coeruleorubidus]WDV51768.1 S8 family serine peptidase [Streptomyces coeruleorubidus]
MRVLIQMKPDRDVVEAVANPQLTATTQDVAGSMPGVELDQSFTPVALPRPVPSTAEGDPLSLTQPLRFSMRPEDATVLVRGEIHDYDAASRLSMLALSRSQIVGVSADPVIQTSPTCPGDGPVGNWQDVKNLLAELGADDLDGSGIALAITDTGINTQHLSNELDRPVTVDAARSWNPPGVTGKPGQFPVDHGTMCAFDALIAAPKATLIDVPVLLSQQQGPTVMSGLLSDAVAAYSHLWSVLETMPDDKRALVVSNSWGSFSPRWDFPPSHPGNYSDNPGHPFNLMVTALESAGADVLFAAGNCGLDCPDGRCEFPDRPIVGANSHPRALSIGGVDTRGNRVGYSSQGPGRLDPNKPDICAYTHFEGSHAFGAGEPDSGTSAACPVAAGVVAAVRTQWSANVIKPAELRILLQRTADDRGAAGFDHDYGFGIINVPAIMDALRRRSKNGHGIRR